MTALVERTRFIPDAHRNGDFSALVALGSRMRRAELVAQLAAIGGVDIVEAGTVAEARARALTGPRDLVVTAMSLPDGSGMGLIADLRSAGWPRGLVLSQLSDPYTVRAALTAGARAFVFVPELGPSSGTVSLLSSAARIGGVHALSARELEVLQLVAQGQSNRDIGAALGLSGLTVKSHLARIARKLGTGDRAEMVVISLRAGVIA